ELPEGGRVHRVVDLPHDRGREARLVLRDEVLDHALFGLDHADVEVERVDPTAAGLRIARLLPGGQQVADDAHIQGEELGVDVAQDLPGVGAELRVADRRVDAADAWAAGHRRRRVEEPDAARRRRRARVVLDDVADQVVIVVALVDGLVFARQQVQGVVPGRAHERVGRIEHLLVAGRAGLLPLFAVQRIPVLRRQPFAHGVVDRADDLLPLYAAGRRLSALLYDVRQLVGDEPTPRRRPRRGLAGDEHDAASDRVGAGVHPTRRLLGGRAVTHPHP